MLPQDRFVAERQRDWNDFDALLVRDKELHRTDPATISRAAALYRSICTDVVRCRFASYTPDLAFYLNGLAGRAHNALYGPRAFHSGAVASFFLRDFPRALRERWKMFALASALFFVPCAIGVVGAMRSVAFAQQVLPPGMLEGMARAYSEGFDEGRSGFVDSAMAGFYVYNNVGIAFRCFATGVLFGIGSMFFLVYNGLLIGTVTGFVIRSGHGANILTFMCGHAPFELTAILISGTAGLQMGLALVDTGGLSRIASVRRHAHGIARLIAGAAVMLLIAAFVEAFWSPSSAPPHVKWIVSAIGMNLVLVYLAFAGRRGPR